MKRWHGDFLWKNPLNWMWRRTTENQTVFYMSFIRQHPVITKNSSLRLNTLFNFDRQKSVKSLQVISSADIFLYWCTSKFRIQTDQILGLIFGLWFNILVRSLRRSLHVTRSKGLWSCLKCLNCDKEASSWKFQTLAKPKIKENIKQNKT